MKLDYFESRDKDEEKTRWYGNDRPRSNKNVYNNNNMWCIIKRNRVYRRSVRSEIYNM